MKFMIIRKADAQTEASVMPGQQLLMDMGRYNESMVNAGVFVDGMGLKPSDCGFRVDFNNGKPMVIDGPFAETKELVAGFTLIEVASREEAVEWVKRWPASDADGNARLEIRQVFEMEDFEQGDGLAVHQALSERLAKQPRSIGPYLNFNGQCAQAFHYYADVLGGAVEFMMTFGDSPASNDVAEHWQEKIMHAHLSLGDQYLMGCDAPEGWYQKPQGFSVQLQVDSAEKAERIFSALAKGGTVHMPMEETFWAKRFGALVDQFDIPWMINYQGDVEVPMPGNTGTEKESA